MMKFKDDNLIISAVPEKSGGRQRQSLSVIGFARINGKKEEKLKIRAWCNLITVAASKQGFQAVSGLYPE